MRNFIILLVFVICQNLSAATKAFNMTFELGEKGKTILNPHITAMAGEQAGISEHFNTEEYQVDVVANEGSKKGLIKLNLKFTRTSLLSGEEHKNFVFDRTIEVKENKSRVLHFPTTDGRELKLKVLAKSQKDIQVKIK